MPERSKWDSWNTTVFDHYMGVDYNNGRYYVAPTGDAARAWRIRENKAQKTRLPLLWHNEVWWRDGHTIWKWHFAHMSTERPGMLAYTADEGKGERDIQTVLKPGRYLEKFFKSRLSEKQIKYYATWSVTGARPPSAWDNYPMKITTDGEQIAWVYKNGIYSCMRKISDSARAYGAGDLGVAYLEGGPPTGCVNADRRVVARTIVWPEKKMASRIYPTPNYYSEDGFLGQEDSLACQTALRAKLKAEGYLFPQEPGWSMRGARLLSHPYLPHYDNIELRSNGDHLEVQ